MVEIELKFFYYICNDVWNGHITSRNKNFILLHSWYSSFPTKTILLRAIIHVKLLSVWSSFGNLNDGHVLLTNLTLSDSTEIYIEINRLKTFGVLVKYILRKNWCFFTTEQCCFIFWTRNIHEMTILAQFNIKINSHLS